MIDSVARICRKEETGSPTHRLLDHTRGNGLLRATARPAFGLDFFGEVLMMVDVVTETVIRRPIGKVAAYASNPDHVRDWYVNIKEVEWKTAPPVAVGSQVAFVATFLGRGLSYTYEIVELVPGEKLVMRTAEGPFPMETTYTWETTPEGFTRMTLRNRGMPTGFSRWVAPLMVQAMRRANKKDLACLKALLEGGRGGS